ncbi:MAG: RluA family pseudouridine synthase [Candidatus Azotimanducaceae bacterium WSBS_2022_MAG_OTU7]
MTTPTKVQIREIDADTAGQRLDNYLIKMLKGLPKSRIYRIIRKGEVRINGKRCKPEIKLVAGDLVRIPPIQHLPARSTAVGHFNDLEGLMVYEDEHLLIINKPAGMAVHGGSGVSVGVIESLRHARPEGSRLELVHRLDRGTSGCLMVSKRRSYLRLLQDALRQPGQIKKHYLAVVHGRWPRKMVQIEQPLLTSSNAGKERITRVNGQGKYAVTDFSLLEATDELSIVRASPRTGRTHQIRVHARWARHPLVGDTRYGDQTLDQVSGVEGRLMLHAAELQIPALGARPAIHVKAPMDEDFLLKVKASFATRLYDIQ